MSKLPNLAPTLMLKLTPGTGITATVDIGEDTEVTTDLMATMDTTERDLLMMPLPLVPTPMLQLTPGTGITAMEDIGEDTEVTMADLMDMVTTERDLLMRVPPPNLAPTPILQLTRGTVTTGMVTTGLTVMVTTALATEAITGDKKWTSRTTSDLSLPADSSVKRQFLQNNFLFTLLKNSFVLCIRVPGTVFNYLQSRNNKNPK